MLFGVLYGSFEIVDMKTRRAVLLSLFLPVIGTICSAAVSGIISDMTELPK